MFGSVIEIKQKVNKDRKKRKVQLVKGTVVGKGKDVHEIEVGDIVQYAEHAMPTPMMHQNVEHLLVQEGDVFAIVRYDEQNHTYI